MFSVPFDKITDCDITEPAGNTCVCVPNVLSVVNVDIASSGQDGKKELRLAGLKDPHSFKRLVWAMKRAQQGAAPSSMSMTARSSTSESETEVASLLREIRDELRANNELLQASKVPHIGNSADTTFSSSAPSLEEEQNDSPADF